MRRLLDRVGWPERATLALLALWVVWSWVAALTNDRIPSLVSPYVLSPVVLVLGVVAGRALATSVRVQTVVAGLVVVTTVFFLSVVWTDGPAKGPTAYANANAAVALQLVGLCGLAMLRAERAQRVVLWLVAGGGVAVIAANHSRAAFALSLPLLGIVALMTLRPARHMWWAALTCVGTIAAASVAVVHLAGRQSWPDAFVTALSSTRQSLWADAHVLWSAHPVTGGGPGSLAESSALGGDPDAASAHSSVLQFGAEVGSVGVAIFAAIVLAGVWWATRGSEPEGVIAMAAWTALAVHSLTDHLLESAAAVCAAGMVIGWASASSPLATHARSTAGCKDARSSTPARH